jgi:hypothetical protein
MAAPSLSALLLDAIPGVAQATESAPKAAPPDAEDPEENPEVGGEQLGCSSLGLATGAWLLILPWIRRRRK